MTTYNSKTHRGRLLNWISPLSKSELQSIYQSDLDSGKIKYVYYGENNATIECLINGKKGIIFDTSDGCSEEDSFYLDNDDDVDIYSTLWTYLFKRGELLFIGIFYISLCFVWFVTLLALPFEGETNPYIAGFSSLFLSFLTLGLTYGLGSDRYLYQPIFTKQALEYKSYVYKNFMAFYQLENNKLRKTRKEKQLEQTFEDDLPEIMTSIGIEGRQVKS